MATNLIGDLGGHFVNGADLITFCIRKRYFLVFLDILHDMMMNRLGFIFFDIIFKVTLGLNCQPHGKMC